MKFIRLFDVDGKIGDGLIVVIKNNFRLLVAHCVRILTKTQQCNECLEMALDRSKVEQHVVEEMSPCYIDQLSVASYTTIRQPT